MKVSKITELDCTARAYLQWGVKNGIYGSSSFSDRYFDLGSKQNIDPLIAAAEARSRMYGEQALRLMFPGATIKQETYFSNWDITVITDGKTLRVEVKLREGEYTYSKLCNDIPYINKEKSESINSLENGYLLTISSDLVAILSEANATSGTVEYWASEVTYSDSDKVCKDRVLYPVEKATSIKQLDEICL